jgi:hypothetical protein
MAIIELTANITQLDASIIKLMCVNAPESRVIWKVRKSNMGKSARAPRKNRRQRLSS